MKLSNIIKSEFVLLKMSVKTRDEMVDGLINALYNSGQKILVGEDLVRKAITARENLRGTLLPTGLSIPHARLEGFDKLIVAIGVPDTPIPPDRGDTPIRMMVLLLTPMSASTQYLNTLAAFAKISGSDLFQKLCNAADHETFINLITDANIEIAQDLTVTSIMSTTIRLLRPENTVREAIDLFYTDSLGYLPIKDSNDHFVGELTMTDLFGICIPAYALKMQSLKFLSNFEPLEDLLRNENKIRVGDIMKAPAVTLDEDAPVFEAVLKFVQQKCRYIPVVQKKDRRLVGVVSHMDVLKKVLRA